MLKMNLITPLLNKQVANWSVLYIKIHNYHWNVKGKHFFTLHAKFEELYNEADKYLDTLAERVLALKEQPVATMKQGLELASIEEAAGGETAEQMVEQLSADFQRISRELQEGIEVAEGTTDKATADMLIQIDTSLQTHIWMLNSFMGKDEPQ